MTLEHCLGYVPTEDSCTIVNATVTAEALEAIRSTATESNLANRPARNVTEVPPGGALISGKVHFDSGRVELPGYPVDSDTARVEAVLRQIEAAFPPEVQAEYVGKLAAGRASATDLARASSWIEAVG